MCPTFCLHSLSPPPLVSCYFAPLVCDAVPQSTYNPWKTSKWNQPIAPFCESHHCLRLWRKTKEILNTVSFIYYHALSYCNICLSNTAASYILCKKGPTPMKCSSAFHVLVKKGCLHVLLSSKVSLVHKGQMAIVQFCIISKPVCISWSDNDAIAGR